MATATWRSLPQGYSGEIKNSLEPFLSDHGYNPSCLGLESETHGKVKLYLVPSFQLHWLRTLFIYIVLIRGRRILRLPASLSLRGIK